MKRGQTIIIATAIVGLLFVTAVPVGAAGTTTLTALATKVNQLTAKVVRLAKDGTIKALFVKYDNSKSGLKATTAQGAIDELGVSVQKLISGSSITAKASSTGSSIRATSVSTALSPTTWKGYGYSYGINPIVNGLVSKTTEIAVTFTPTSANTGTFTSNPLYVFAPAGGDFFSKQYGDSVNTPGGISRCGTPASAPNGGIYPTGTFTGNYEITDDFMIWTAPTSSTHSNCVVPDQNGNSYSRLSSISSKGTTLYINNSSGNQLILTRQ